jgi:hypothetical protein
MRRGLGRKTDFDSDATLRIPLTGVHRRYLRARKFVPEEALKQFKDTEDWRKANKLDELYDTIDIGEYESSRRLVSSYNCTNLHSH